MIGNDDEQYSDINRSYLDELDNLLVVQLPESLSEEICDELNHT